jgi:SAM-dependent methyltransferase
VSVFSDPKYLLEKQYRTDDNLQARIDLHRRFSTNPEPWHRWVFDRLELGPQADLLEVGSGPAEFWAENIERIPGDWRLTLSDLSPGMLHAASSVLGDRADYVLADAQELPFPDASFDAVIANHMLYHVPDRGRALGEISRLLRPGGRAYVATNGCGHLQQIKALQARPVEWGFDLETAARELSAVFPVVELEHYPGDLEVTKTEPVLAFVRSLDRGEVEGIREIVAEEIARNGSFHATKSTGLFRCHKP